MATINKEAVAHLGEEINMTAKDKTAPDNAVFQLKDLNAGRKLGAPETFNAKHAMFNEK